MVEVFKTNVDNRDHANLLVGVIHKSIDNCTASFDLNDCDRVLRIQSTTGEISVDQIISLISYYGYIARVMEDELVSEKNPEDENKNVLEFIFNYQ